MRKTINDFRFHSILIDVAPVDDAILFEHNFAQQKVNMTVLHISTCCFAIMLICGLLFQLLTALIQNPHEHWNVERLLFALAQFADIRFADGCYFELNLFSLQWHYLLFSIFLQGREKEVKTKIWLSRTCLLHRLYLFFSVLRFYS